MSHLPYRLTTHLALRLPLPRGKLADSVRGRQRATERWLQWASTQRTNGPLLWVHGASVGEGLTAQPVVARVKSAVPGLQTVHTFSSPSAESWPQGFGTDRSDYVPPDEPSRVARVLRALNPSLLVFSRGDLWPELVAQAEVADVPVAVIGGTVQPSSRRLSWPARSLLGTMHRGLCWVGAASEADADRWQRLGVPNEAVTVTGDPRHDQIVERVPRLEAIQPLVAWARNREVLVAGSVDRVDGRVLLEAFSRVSRSHHSAGFILVPHDPNRRSIAALVKLAARYQIRLAVWLGGEISAGASGVVAATLGLLADVYLMAQLAYVGGGFHAGQLHAVAEPAALGIPVIVGPKHRSSTDAQRLLQGGGAVSLPAKMSSETCATIWGDWLSRPEIRIQSGLNARRALQQGAARATASALVRIAWPQTT